MKNYGFWAAKWAGIAARTDQKLANGSEVTNEARMAAELRGKRERWQI